MTSPGHINNINRYVQPAGFLLLLLYFIFSNQPGALISYWIGAFLTLTGAIIELIMFHRTAKPERTQVSWVFHFGFLVKCFLVVAISLRIYDLPYSVFVLLAGIVAAVIWYFLSQFIHPEKAIRDDILDID